MEFHKDSGKLMPGSAKGDLTSGQAFDSVFGERTRLALIE
jgi:hypothetical protein